MARKNGKTALIAALVLVHLCGPEAQINSDIASAANDKDQAGQVFKYVRQIVQLSLHLSKILTIVESTKRIAYHGRGNVYGALSSEAGTKHGMNPTIVIYDELAQSKNRELFDTLETSQGAQHEPIFFIISTQSPDPQHPLSLLIDDALTGKDSTSVCHLYEVPEDVKDIFNPACWIGANPALGDFRSIPELKKYADRAKRLPSLENVLRNLYLNQRVSTLATLFSRSVWMACKGVPEFKARERVFLGLDLSSTTDLASLVMVSEEGCRMTSWFWKPDDLLEEHGRRDRKDYLLWQKQGFMEPCEGKTFSADNVAVKIAWVHENFDIVGLAYDRWNINPVIKALDRQGIECSKEEWAQLRLYPWGQGYKDISPAINAFETVVVDGALVHDSNPVMNWNIANAIVTQDAAGNRKLDKSKTRMRIDGAVAAAMAIGLRHQSMDDSIKSIYQKQKPLLA